MANNKMFLVSSLSTELLEDLCSLSQTKTTELSGNLNRLAEEQFIFMPGSITLSEQWYVKISKSHPMFLKLCEEENYSPNLTKKLLRL